MTATLLAEIISILTSAVGLLPELESIIPVIESLVNGNAPTAAELEALIAARQAIEAKIPGLTAATVAGAAA